MNIKNEKGITLVAVVIAIIVMIILASVTLNTTFTAYETARSEKFKAQMKVLQESVTNLNSDFGIWQKEKADEYRENIRKKELESGEDSVPNDQKIQSDGSLPNYFYNTNSVKKYLDEKHDSIPNSKVIGHQQFKDLNLDCKRYIIADFYGISYDEKIKSGNFTVTKEDGSEIIKFSSTDVSAAQNNKVIATINSKININDCIFYKFSKNDNDIENYLGARNIDFDRVYIDIEHLFIFTDTNPVKVDKQKIYTQYAFSDSNTIFTNDTKSTIDDASILVDVIANYGTSKKIKLTLNSEVSNNNNNMVDYKIRKAYYLKSYVDANVTGTWYEADDLKECEYSRDGKSVTFVVYESGDYKFRIQDVSGGYTDKMKQNVNLNIRKIQPEYKEIENYYNITLCNAPVLNPDMKPVKWMYNDKNRIEGKWVICSTIDPEWYNYSKDYKMWANIICVHDKNTNKTLQIGDELSESELGSMFVWVPRYALEYSGITFFRGTSRTSTYGKNMYTSQRFSEDAFRNLDYKLGGWDSELKGLWYSKYDMGLEDVDEKSTPKKISKINTSQESIAKNYNTLYSSNQTFRPVSKPYYITWRNISYTSAFSQALMYYNNFEHAITEKNLNTHLMKDSELLALQRLSFNEIYGNSNISSNTSNKLSAGSDGVNGYSFQKEYTNQSSTGNITGIFDITGTTEVMLSALGPVLKSNENEKEYLYNNLMQTINVVDSVENDSDIEKANNNSNKYYKIGQLISLTRNGGSYIRLGEIAGSKSYTSEKWIKISETASHNNGFRIVMSNSPSGDSSSYIYDSTNISEMARDDLPGFYVTDDNGNYIKNADGKFLDSAGNKTFYSWNEMIENEWIKVDDGVVNKGLKISELKQKTGILIISDSVSKLGYNVFDNWYKTEHSSIYTASLLKVILPDTITEIGSSAFRFCSDLKEIKMSQKLEIVGSFAFTNCESLVNYSLPESLKEIQMYAFSDCINLESITIPRNVQNIGARAFQGCRNVTSLEILSEAPNLEIGTNAFSETDHVKSDTGLKIKSLIIPSNVSVIKEQAFSGCRELENIIIEDGVKEIYNGAFAYCTKLNTINFPNSIISIGKIVEYPIRSGDLGVLQNCKSLEEVDLSSINNIGTLQCRFLAGCSSLKEVKLPNTGLETLEYICFSGCSALKNIIIPNTIKNIKQDVFGDEGVTLEEIPSIYLQYTGSKDEWNSINKRIITNIDDWYNNITVIVGTSDGEIIEYSK